MKAKILKKLAEAITKKPATEQFKKVRQLKKETNDLAKKNNIEVGMGKYGVLNDKLNKSIGNKNLSEAKKIVKDMKDFINNKKDTPKKQIKGVKAGIKALSKAEKKIKTPAKKPLKEGTLEFRKVYRKKFDEAKAKGQKRISINNVIRRSPDGKGFEDKAKKAFYTVIRDVDPKTGKKRAKKKRLEGLTAKEKMQRKALESDARKKMKGKRKETEGMGEKGATVKLSDRVQSLNNKAKGKTPAQILKEGRVSPATNRYVNPNFIERTDAAALPKMSKEARKMRRMAQLKVLPKGFFRSKTEELDVVRGDIPPRLTAQQIMEEMRENVLRGTKVVGREIEEKGISGPAQKTVVKGKTAEIAVPAAQELKKFPKRKTLSIGDKLKGTLATERNIKKQILKINKGDFGGPNKSLVSNVPNKPIGKKEQLVEKGVAYDRKSKTAEIFKFRKDEIQRYRKALDSSEKSIMSNTAKATLNDLKNRSVIKNATKGSPYATIKNRVSKLIEKQKELKPKLIGSLKMKLDNLNKNKPAATGVKEKFGVIPRKKGGMLNYKAGTKRKTVGKSSKPKLGKFKGAMLSLMPMGVYDSIDMIDTAIRTGLPIKTGTGKNTIRGIGRAMRGYGKALTGRKK